MNQKRAMHAMIDLETAGQSTRAAVFSLGIVLFDPWGDPPDEPRKPYASDHGNGQLYRNLILTDQVRRGMVYEEGTIRWWLKQPEEARMAILADPDPISPDRALKEMESFLKRAGVKHIWAHGVDFDVAIITTLWLNLFGPDVKTPWFFSNTEHTRTLFRQAYTDGKPPSLKLPVAHHALIDAYRQACGVQEALRQMRDNGIIWPNAPIAMGLFE